MKNLKGSLVLACLTLNTILWFIPIFTLALVKLLLPFTSARRALTRWLMWFAECWISGTALIFGTVNDTRWEVRGLEGLSRDEWYLVLPNHQTWVDIVVLQTITNRRIPLLKFFIKQQLVWLPFLGIGFWALDMPFMKRYSKSYLAKHPEKKGADLEVTRRACEKFRYTPTSVINFVEGTRFSEEKRQRRQSPYEFLLPPRAGGVALAVATMGDMFTDILDVTLYYPDGVPKFWDMICGEFSAVVVDVRRRPVESWMPGGDYVNDRDYRKRFHQWLGAVWADKDARLRAFREKAA